MTLLFKQSVEMNKEALCVKLGSDQGIMREVTMALLITCSFCPGEYVLFKTVPQPRDMRACVHRHACIRSCDCTHILPLDMRCIACMHMRACACECTCMLRTDHVFLLSRRLRSLRNRAAAARHARMLALTGTHARLRLHAHAAARHAHLRVYAHAAH
jgi:hypothetical protein